MPPRDGEPFLLYISASEDSIGSFLAQKNEEGKEQAISYLSRLIKVRGKRKMTLQLRISVCACISQRSSFGILCYRGKRHVREITYLIKKMDLAPVRKVARE